MTVYLTLDDFLRAAQENADYPIQVRDMGLLLSALQRPAQTMFGEELYPTVRIKAAALLQSLSRNHALMDGNKRASLDAFGVFWEWNGYIVTLAEPQATELIIAVAEGRFDEVDDIANAIDAIATFEEI